MEYTVTRAFTFSASHQLAGLPAEHKCSRLHGHSYDVTVHLAGSLDDVGFVLDFGELDWVGKLISERLDHRHLNEVIDINPTSENVAAWMLKHVLRWLDKHTDKHRMLRTGVTVSESRATSASVWHEIQ